MTLYEIGAVYADFLDALDAGEIPDEAIADTLEGLDGLYDDKIDNIVCAMKNLNAEAEAIKAEEKTLAERRQAKEIKYELYKRLVTQSMQSIGKKKIETARNNISLHKSSSVHIINVKQVLDNIQYVKPRRWSELDISKTAVREALQAGIPVPGAEMTMKMNLQVK